MTLHLLSDYTSQSIVVKNDLTELIMRKVKSSQYSVYNILSLTVL